MKTGWPLLKIGMSKKRFVCGGILLTIGAIAFQNCAPASFQVQEGGAPQSFLFNESMLGNCLQGGEVCVYIKSPFYQSKVLANDSKRELPRFDVKLIGLDESGYLKNEVFEIVSNTPAKKQNGQWVFANEKDALAQFSAYYYIESLVDFLRKKGATQPKKIKVILNAPASGWVPEKKEIYLARLVTGEDVAFDGSLVVYFAALAFIDGQITGGSQIQKEHSLHKNCGPKTDTVYQNECCVSERGCMNALSSGIADYLVGVMFPESPILGEYLTQRESGMGHCGLSRDLNSNFSIDRAFTACEFAHGQMQNLGSVYAQIWWAARKQYTNNDLERFDSLFVKHVSLLQTSDDFVSAFAKINALDAKEFGGQFFSGLKQQAEGRNLR